MHSTEEATTHKAGCHTQEAPPGRAAPGRSHTRSRHDDIDFDTDFVPVETSTVLVVHVEDLLVQL